MLEIVGRYLRDIVGRARSEEDDLLDIKIAKRLDERVYEHRAVGKHLREHLGLAFNVADHRLMKLVSHVE